MTNPASVAEELHARIAEVEQQEHELVFPRFTQNDAWRLGSICAEIILRRELTLAVDIMIATHLVFRAKLNDSSVDTDAWLAGKSAVTRHFDASSLLVRYRLELAGGSVSDHGLDPDAFRSHGGSFPIRVAGAGLVATITTSGAPDTVDHAIAVEAVREYLAAR